MPNYGKYYIGIRLLLLKEYLQANAGKEKTLETQRVSRVWWSLLDCDSLRSLHALRHANQPALRLASWGVVDRTAGSPVKPPPTKKHHPFGWCFPLVETAGLEPVTSCV